ncbi:MAG: antitoxin [Candidatus Micrarchaeaceae archaeon]|jgi:hypothetical protein|nr:DUF2683 family protein [Candidatus Micrarchaeota archaeon]HII09942.1 DUF2683 family protein [Candidatus Micrarchaeota archaeon]
MVKALITINDEANRVLNIIKAEYGLRDKSQAINRMAKEYEELVFEPKVKASYLKKLKKISKEKTTHIGTLKDFDRMFGTHE